MEPTIGRTVLYRLKPEDLERFDAHLERFGGGAHTLVRETPDATSKIDRLEWCGNVLHPGDAFPLIIVRPWHTPGQYVQGSSCLNGRVLLDGPFDFWALSVAEGTVPGTWAWPPRVEAGAKP